MMVRVCGDARAHEQQHKTGTSGAASGQRHSRNGTAHGHADEGTVYLEQQSGRVSKGEGLGRSGTTARQW